MKQNKLLIYSLMLFCLVAFAAADCTGKFVRPTQNHLYDDTFAASSTDSIVSNGYRFKAYIPNDDVARCTLALKDDSENYLWTSRMTRVSSSSNYWYVDNDVFLRSEKDHVSAKVICYDERNLWINSDDSCAEREGLVITNEPILAKPTNVYWKPLSNVLGKKLDEYGATVDVNTDFCYAVITLEDPFDGYRAETRYFMDKVGNRCTTRITGNLYYGFVPVSCKVYALSDSPRYFVSSTSKAIN